MSLLLALGLVWASMSAVMALAWVHQRRLRNAGVVDIYWTIGTGLACAAVALFPFDGEPRSIRQWAACGLMLAWAGRLATHILERVSHSPREDARYARLREEWAGRFEHRLLWFLQAQPPITALLALSVMIAAHRTGPLDLRDFAALAIWLVAIEGENRADRQLARFKAETAEAGAVCDRGLWAWSRHPNYFFEWLGWLAWPVMALGAPWWPAALAAPAAMYLVLRHGSGVPPLEASMEASRGQGWRDYAARTPVFFPRPPRRS